jgi:NAD(P)-dependent dehydrogenase (short-subunit alcohol dehydrogenase family)
MTDLLISRLGLASDQLRGETIIVTGAGGGIGYEAARAFLWLGANVVIAEIDPKGAQATEGLNAEFPGGRALFVQTDVGAEASVQGLHRESVQRFGKVDVVINNATIAVLGQVKDLPIDKWDASYRVNLRGPVLMAQTFLPGMIERWHGVFICVSSTGTAFLGGYETFKAAQVHLANTLDAELEGTGVIAFTIGPGLVPTATASAAVDQLAPQMGMTVEEFIALNKNAILTPEEAGAGFAAAVVFAEKFKGMEISSIQALKAADINFGAQKSDLVTIGVKEREQVAALCTRVRRTLQEQSDGWKQRSIFERQWVIRDFRKTTGMSVEEWLAALERLESGLQAGASLAPPPLDRLAGYYGHLAELAKGYEKDPAKLEENLHHMYRWRDEAQNLDKLLRK